MHYIVVSQSIRKAEGYQMGWADCLKDDDAYEIYESEQGYLSLSDLVCVCQDRVQAMRVKEALELVDKDK